MGVRPLSAPSPGGDPAICPHCWMVNPGAFRLCARCGGQMDTHLQESGGLRHTSPVQSPVPVGPRLSVLQRTLVALFLALMTLTYLVQLLPRGARSDQTTPAPAPSSGNH